MMDFLPQKFLCALPLWVGGAVLGAVGVITSIVGLCGGLKEFDEAIEVLGFNTFSIRSLSVISLVVSILYLFAVYCKRSLIMLPGIIWYLALSAVAHFYLVASMVLTFHSLLTRDKQIDGRWFLYEFSWLAGIVILSYFSIIAITLYIRTNTTEKHPRNDTHPNDDTHSHYDAHHAAV